MSSTRHQEQQRNRVAMLAAKYISESGISDFQLAKRKAAQHLGVDEKRYMPSNKEIESALFDHQKLFYSDSQPEQLKKCRETAVHAMQFLKSFNPRLVGDVLSGTANEYSHVEVHVFADYPEQVRLFFLEEQIPFDEKQKRIKMAGHYKIQPVYNITADDVDVDVVVFSCKEMRQAPDSPVDGQPMPRADLKTVQALLKSEQLHLG